MNSNASLIEYFGDDRNDKKKMARMNNRYFYHEYNVNFSIMQYFETLFIHVAALVALGPMINLYSVIFRKRAPWLLNNLHFSRWKTSSFWVQYIQWFFSVWSFYFYAFTTSPIADYVTMGYVATAYLLRSSSIAGKYATYPRNLYKKICEQKVPEKEFVQQLMLFGWFRQDEDVIQLEIDSTIKRAEIDDALFRVAFMAEINEEAKQEFKNIVADNKEYYKENKVVTLGTTCCTKKRIKYYDAKIIYEFLIKQYNKNQSLGLPIRAFILFYAIFNAFWPAGIRMIYSQTPFGYTIPENICYAGNGFNIMFMVLTTVMFFAAGLRDMKRKAFMLNQLGQYLSPKKLQKYRTDKLLPTINFLDQVSLHTWIDLRKLTIDYGKKYFFRHEIFMPVIFFIGIFSLVSLFVILADFIPFGNSMVTEIELKKLKVGFAGAAVYFLFLFFLLLYSAAYINEQFEVHKEILQNNKDLLQDILIFKEFYFAKQLNPELIPTEKEILEMDHYDQEFGFKEEDESNTNLIEGEENIMEVSLDEEVKDMTRTPSKPGGKILTYDVKSLLGKKSTSYVHRRIARELSEVLGPSLKANLQDHLSNLIMVTDLCKEQLTNQKEFSDVKILGVSVTVSNVNGMLLGIVSICLTAYEIFING